MKTLEPISPEFQEGQPISTAPVIPTPPPITPAQPSSTEWQTKQQYVATQQIATEERKGSPVTRVAAIVLGVGVFLFILSMTPIGDAFSFTGTGFRAMQTRPLMGVASLVVIVSYFVMTIAGIIEAKKGSSGRIVSIVGLVLGALLLGNPLGLVIAYMLVTCNFTSCSGS